MVKNNLKERVLLVTGSLNQGGAEFQIIQLAGLLKDNGYEVMFVSLTSHDFYEAEILKKNVDFVKLSNNLSKIRRVWNCSRIIRSYRPNVIISYLKFTSQVALLAKIISGRRCKLIIGERTSYTSRYFDLYYFNLMRLADYITSNSVSKVAYLKNRFPHLQNKVIFIPNILEVDRFMVHPKSADGGRVRLAFIGRISPEKNVLLLVKAVIEILNSNEKILLNIYGDTRNSSYTQEVKDLISKSGFIDEILLKGKTDDVATIYAESDAICLLSKYEGFSNVLSEALSTGVPIIASNIDENRYMVEDGVNGFLANIGSVEQVVLAIMRFLQLSNEERSLMGRRNRIKAEYLFDKRQIYTQYQKIFSSI